jgi:cell division protein FtsI (penicillin-binding protein 3)/stage V sporulation protein D (sporulation-specific penicillin-binding protein)
MVPAWRFAVFATAVILGCGGILARLVYLHAIAADHLAAEAAANRRGMLRLEGRRGNITDRAGNLLAGTRTRISVGADPWALTARDRTLLPELAQLLELDPAATEARATARFRAGAADQEAPRPQRWVPLAVVDEDLYARVEALRLKGVYGNRRYERTYPGGELAAHLLGYLNRDQTAVMGIERALDFYLRGENGWTETELDGRRRELPVFRSREVAPRGGYHVELTIDLFVQSVIEAELQRLADAYQPAGASVIVSDPRTGEILGLANYPTFDPNQFWEFPIENQRNRAATDVHEPGSTFKIVPVAAALEEGLIRPETQFDCNTEVVTYRARRIRLPADHASLGTIPLTQVVAKSSNRGAALIGMGLGEERLHRYCQAFGFGQPTGWLLDGEVGGTLHPVRNWDGLTISRLPTGYAVSATPLQVHYGMAVIAGQGMLRTPRLVRRVFDDSGRTVLEMPTRERRRVISEITAERVAEMLQGVIREGTARRAELPGFSVAGKTGTARKIIDGQYSTRHHFATFSGFFPADDPQVVITVVVDDPQLTGSGYGGVVAAPAFKEIGARLIHHLAIRKPETQESLLVAR